MLPSRSEGMLPLSDPHRRSPRPLGKEALKIGRAYINNFQDKGKQAAIDMLLVSLPESFRTRTAEYRGNDGRSATRHSVRPDWRLGPVRYERSHQGVFPLEINKHVRRDMEFEWESTG